MGGSVSLPIIVGVGTSRRPRFTSRSSTTRADSVSAPAATPPSPDGETSARTMPEALPVGPPASPGDGVALSGAAAALSAAGTCGVDMAGSSRML